MEGVVEVGIIGRMEMEVFEALALGEGEVEVGGGSGGRRGGGRMVEMMGVEGGDEVVVGQGIVGPGELDAGSFIFHRASARVLLLVLVAMGRCGCEMVRARVLSASGVRGEGLEQKGSRR